MEAPGKIFLEDLRLMIPLTKGLCVIFSHSMKMTNTGLFTGFAVRKGGGKVRANSGLLKERGKCLRPEY